MRHFKEHMNHKYLGLDKKDINLKGYMKKLRRK